MIMMRQAADFFINHSAKGSEWKDHKYIKRVDGTYYYPDDYDVDDDTDGAPDVTIACPVYTDVIYPETKCVISDDAYDQIEMYLPYAGTTEAGVAVKISKRDYDDYQQRKGGNYLAVTMDTCDDAAKVAAGQQYFAEWMQTRYLDVDDYYVEYLNVCGADTLGGS